MFSNPANCIYCAGDTYIAMRLPTVHCDIDTEMDRIAIQDTNKHVCNCRKRKFTSLCTPSDTARCADVTGVSAQDESISHGHQINHAAYGTSSGVEYAVIEAMSRFYLLVRRMKAHNLIDLNAVTSESDVCETMNRRSIVDTIQRARSPWDLGPTWDYRQQENLHYSSGGNGMMRHRQYGENGM